MSQRRQDQLADRRNHLDLQINLLSEQENSKMLAMLAALLRQQGLALDDPEVAALQEATRPEVLVQQLADSIELSGKLMTYGSLKFRAVSNIVVSSRDERAIYHHE